MKNSKPKKTSVFILNVLLFCLCGAGMFAQTGGAPPPPPGGPGPPGMPIDGFVVVTLVVGACLGIKKLKKDNGK